MVGYHQYANGTYNQVGVGLTIAGFELPVVFDDVDEVHPVPLTVDATLESTAAYTIQVPEALTYAVDQTRYSEVDGYGTLLLPDGTSHEVLRLKSTVVSVDSIYIDLAGEGFAFERETVTYSWLGDGGMPWMEVSTTFGIPSVVRYQEARLPPPLLASRTSRVSPSCSLTPPRWAKRFGWGPTKQRAGQCTPSQAPCARRRREPCCPRKAWRQGCTSSDTKAPASAGASSSGKAVLPLSGGACREARRT